MGNSFHLHALDLTTGAEKFGGPTVVTASVPGTSSKAVNGVVKLSNGCVQRAALLLINNVVVIGFGSGGSGWLLTYNAQTLQQVGVFNSSPNLDGLNVSFPGTGGVWMSGGGQLRIVMDIYMLRLGTGLMMVLLRSATPL